MSKVVKGIGKVVGAPVKAVGKVVSNVPVVGGLLGKPMQGLGKSLAGEQGFFKGVLPAAAMAMGVPGLLGAGPLGGVLGGVGGALGRAAGGIPGVLGKAMGVGGGGGGGFNPLALAGLAGTGLAGYGAYKQASEANKRMQDVYNATMGAYQQRQPIAQGVNQMLAARMGMLGQQFQPTDIFSGYLNRPQAPTPTPGMVRPQFGGGGFGAARRLNPALMRAFGG